MKPGDFGTLTSPGYIDFGSGATQFNAVEIKFTASSSTYIDIKPGSVVNGQITVEGTASIPVKQNAAAATANLLIDAFLPSGSVVNRSPWCKGR